MKWHVFWLRMDKRPPPRRGAVNILNKQLRTTDKEWQSTLEVGRGAKNSLPYERTLLLIIHKFLGREDRRMTDLVGKPEGKIQLGRPGRI